MLQYLSTFLKGIFIGGSMLIPGVSGGTMAMIFNIYDDLIKSINQVIKLNFKRLFFLIAFGVGGIAGFFLFAPHLETLLEKYPYPVTFFFLGAVVGGVPLMYKKSGAKLASVTTFIYPVIGVIMVGGLNFINTDPSAFTATNGIKGIIMLFVVGIMLAVALILPGISTSFVLAVMGIHGTFLNALSTRDFGFLLPIAIGGVVGILLTTGILEKIMNDYPKQTYLIIIGFILGSTFKLVAGLGALPSGTTLVLCASLFVFAAVLFKKISEIEEKKE